MLQIPPPQSRNHRRRAKRKAPSGPLPLTLVGASFDPDTQTVGLTFDRDIEFGADWQADQFHVVDAVTTHNEYVGNADGAGRTGPNFGMIMDVAGAASGDQVLLTVGPGNGLIAADDGGTWAGVTDLELPYPPPPAPLVMESASFNSSELSVTITFDRAISIATIHNTAFHLLDGPAGNVYEALETSLTAPNALKVMLAIVGSTSGPDVLLTVTAFNGIVAVDDGGHWTGVVNRALPWP